MPGKADDELGRVAALWDQSSRNKETQPLQGWLDSPLVREICVVPRVTSTPGSTWVEGLMERVGLRPGGRWLSLGCGAGVTEIAAGRRGVFASLDALDASTVSVATARRAAAAAGVTNIMFGDIDLNHAKLPQSHYNVVMMEMSLHHVRELEALLDEISRALKPDGYLFVNEFVGPRQFQFPDLQLGIVRELLEVLPPRLRQDSWTGGLKTEYVRMPIEHWNAVDPSESIRSDEIVAAIGRAFDITTRVDYGGTVLMLLLEHIVHNFDPSNEGDVALLRLLANTEGLLIRHGVIPSDFTMIAARPRPPGVSIDGAPRVAPPPLSDAGGNLAIVAERDALAERLRAIERSRPWRLAQWLRGLIGRRW
jgi:SAM-dependent methyltransferase